MVATGIMDGSQAQPRMEVVQPMGRAVGSSYGMDELEPVQSQASQAGTNNEGGGLMPGRRGSSADTLPMFDAETASDIDVPTFLRRQAD